MISLFNKKALAVTVIQMLIELEQCAANLARAEKLIDEAAVAGARLIVLPEAFATGVNLTNLKKSAAPLSENKTVSFLCKKAVQHQVYIVAGVLEREQSDIYDSAVLISPAGGLLGKYRRWFLWDREKEFLSAGACGSCITTPIGKIGLLIGYDIYFPEACRQYFKEKVDVLICVANLFEDYSLLLEDLCKVRAMENHCYFVLANCLGCQILINKHYAGRSLVACDPTFLRDGLGLKPTSNFGLLGQVKAGEGLLPAKLYLDYLSKNRKEVPQYDDFDFATRELAKVD